MYVHDASWFYWNQANSYIPNTALHTYQTHLTWKALHNQQLRTRPSLRGLQTLPKKCFDRVAKVKSSPSEVLLNQCPCVYGVLNTTQTSIYIYIHIWYASQCEQCHIKATSMQNKFQHIHKDVTRLGFADAMTFFTFMYVYRRVGYIQRSQKATGQVACCTWIKGDTTKYDGCQSN